VLVVAEATPEHLELTLAAIVNAGGLVEARHDSIGSAYVSSPGIRPPTSLITRGSPPSMSTVASGCSTVPVSSAPSRSAVTWCLGATSFA